VREFVESDQVSNAAQKPTGEGKALRILVVDDEEPVRELCTRLLERHGHKVVTAKNEAGAIELLLHSCEDGLPFDILLSDICIGTERGPDLVRMVRQLFPRFPVVFMTGIPNATKLLDNWPPGSYALIHKPYLVENLIDTLQDHLATYDETRPIIQ